MRCSWKARDRLEERKPSLKLYRKDRAKLVIQTQEDNECSPISIFRWERNDDIIPGATTNTYVIPAISYDYNNNKISCIATNKVGTSRIDKTLEVKCKYSVVHKKDLFKSVRKLSMSVFELFKSLLNLFKSVLIRCVNTNF